MPEFRSMGTRFINIEIISLKVSRTKSGHRYSLSRRNIFHFSDIFQITLNFSIFFQIHRINNRDRKYAKFQAGYEYEFYYIYFLKKFLFFILYIYIFINKYN